MLNKHLFILYSTVADRSRKKRLVIDDDFVKSRHPGENRGPEIFNCLIPPLAGLDSGFRRNDVKGILVTFYETIIDEGNLH